jgi:hypothetical protein
MLHGEGPAIEVGGEQRLWMAGVAKSIETK